MKYRNLSKYLSIAVTASMLAASSAGVTGAEETNQAVTESASTSDADSTDSSTSDSSTASASDSSTTSTDSSASSDSDSSTSSTDSSASSGSDSSTSSTDSSASSDSDSSTSSTDASDSTDDAAAEPDLTNATEITIQEGLGTTITKAGTYVISGTGKDTSITVNTSADAEVQIVLDDLSITNEDIPAINVISCGKCTIFTADGSNNTLTVTDSTAANSEQDSSASNDSETDETTSDSSSSDDASDDTSENASDSDTDTDTSDTDTEASDSASGLQADFSRKERNNFRGHDTNDSAAVSSRCELIFAGSGSLTITSDEEAISVSDDITFESGSYIIDSDQAIEAYAITINDGTFDITSDAAFSYRESGKMNGGTVTVNDEKVTELENSDSTSDQNLRGNPGGVPNGQQTPGTRQTPDSSGNSAGSGSQQTPGTQQAPGSTDSSDSSSSGTL